ncbi:MAG: tRNA (adenosine(37)-N6)-threonylcarbamoyltransferase complex dimerization subunit type 1 TsaB [Bdellovibrionales bacterium]
MAVLAISTAAETIVAVRNGDKTFYRINTERRRQAEFLVPMINELLEEAGVPYGKLKRVGITTGPGSFTGLRVGLATAQGIALGTNIPCVGLSTFLCWRSAARLSGITAPLCVALDTLRDDIFITAYDRHEHYDRCLLEPQVMDVAGAEKLLAENPYLSLVGDAFTQLPNHTFVPLTHTMLAEALLNTAQQANPDQSPPLPVYLRAPDVTVAA